MMSFSYVEGYGWHCSRLLLALLLLLAAVFVPFVAVAIQALLQAMTHTRLPYGLVFPAVFLFALVHRLRRKLGGEPFVAWVPGSDLYVRKTFRRDEPVRFFFLFALEV